MSYACDDCGPDLHPARRLLGIGRRRGDRPHVTLRPDRLRQLPRHLVHQRERHRAQAPYPITLAGIRPVVVARRALHRLSIRTARISRALGHECRWIGAAPANPDGGFPDWSPDGSMIAYANPGGPSGMSWNAIMSADGSGQRRLPHTDVGEYPSWSPDGKRIAFHSNRSGHHLMYVVDVDGSRVVNLSRVGEGGLVAWSPDGHSILFASQRDHSDNSRDIYVMRPDGSSLRRLTRTPAPGADTPAWSPDSRYIVYARAGGLGVMRADGSSATLLPIEGVGEAVFPDWR